MGSIGVPEVMVVLILALIVLGPDKLPKAAQTIGKAVHEFRRITGGFEAEVRSVVREVMDPVNQVSASATAASTGFTEGVGATVNGTSTTPTAAVDAAGWATGGPAAAAPGADHLGGSTPTAGLDEPATTAAASRPQVPLDPSLN